MGATDFAIKSKGKTANEAFRAAVQEALHLYGHGGYTGTIAEKHAFTMVTPRLGETTAECVERCTEDLEQFGSDMPAGCIDLGPATEIGTRVFVFFGWASE